MRRIIDKRNKEKFQVDDAYLNGWAKKCGIHATGVYMVMCRHSNKEQECFPSKKLIAEKLAISERSVYTAIKTLEAHHIVEIISQGRKKTGEFLNLTYVLLDKSEWKEPSANCAVGTKRHQPSANGANDRRHVVPNKDTHIDKDTHNKETHLAGSLNSPADPVNQILDIFYKSNNSLNWGNKTHRKASAYLIDKYGLEKTIKIARAAIACQTEKYAPVITTPYELKEKLSKLLLFYAREKSNQNSYIKL